MIEGLAVVAFGAAFALLGVWFYLDPRSSRFIVPRAGWPGSRLFEGPALGMMSLPFGAGFALIGVAFAIGRNPITLGIFYVGLVAVGIGLILFFVHPRWAQPRWMRNS